MTILRNQQTRPLMALVAISVLVLLMALVTALFPFEPSSERARLAGTAVEIDLNRD